MLTYGRGFECRIWRCKGGGTQALLGSLLSRWKVMLRIFADWCVCERAHTGMCRSAAQGDLLHTVCASLFAA